MALRPHRRRAGGSRRVRQAPGGERGRLSALIHQGTGETSRYEQFIEALTTISPYLYSCPNVRTRYRLARLDTSTPTYMRGPGAASGIFALESAMNELAVELGIDPIELRLRNEPEIDEGENRPFSSPSLLACYERGAARFGWERRDPRPGSMRNGRLLIGWGIASATYPVVRAPASVRARLLPDGTAEVEAAASDMGLGTYTSMTQVAADALGLPPTKVCFELGRSDFPPTPPHGGSMTMASVGSAIHAACLAAREQAISQAISDDRSVLRGAATDAIEVRAGRLSLRNDGSRGQTRTWPRACSTPERCQGRERPRAARCPAGGVAGAGRGASRGRRGARAAGNGPVQHPDRCQGRR